MKLWNLLLVLPFIVECSTSNNKVLFDYAYPDPRWGIKPAVIFENALVQRVRLENSTKYFWIQHVKNDTSLKDCYRFDVYLLSGMYLGGYYFKLADSSEYPTNEIFEKAVKTINYTPTEKVDLTEYFIVQNETFDLFLQTKDKTYLMYEVVPSIVQGKDRKRIYYFDYAIPESVEKHAAPYEDVAKENRYKWISYSRNIRLDSSRVHLFFDVYSYSGIKLGELDFIISDSSDFQPHNYSFYRTMFYDSNLFINHWKKYEMFAINWKL